MNLVNERFGKLVVQKLSDNYKKGDGRHRVWECQCDCGKVTLASTAKLRYGHKKSCGCLIGHNLDGQRKAGKHHPQWLGYEEISGSLWLRIKNAAEQRNIQFDITIEYAWSLYVSQSGKCALSGAELYIAKSSKELSAGKNTASLDRINSDLGYERGNVQWLHVDVNYMKQWFEQDKFLEWCKRINLHQDTKNE